MSLEAITWAFRQSLTPSEKLVLLTLADYADDENKCWPKQETLATRTGLTRPTIALKMRTLEERNLIMKKPNKKHERHGRSNHRRLLKSQHTLKLLKLNPKLVNSTNISPLGTGEIRVALL